MNTNPLKDEEQTKAINAWLANKCRGTLQLCTSFGKTYTAIKAALFLKEKWKPDLKILILASTEVIRDDVWKNEFKKWKQTAFYNKHCHTECIQTAYRWKNTEWDLVIVDEIHNYLSPEYSAFFFENKMTTILGLSAMIPPKKVEMINRIAPILYTLSIQEAVEKGIVAGYTIFRHNVSLTPEERSKYSKINSTYSYYESQLGGPGQAFQTAALWMKSDDDKEKKIAGIYYNQMRMRKTLLYDAKLKIKETNKIIDRFPDAKIIIFSETKNFAEKIAEQREDTVAYHSGMGKKARAAALALFKDKRTKIRVVSSVKALNEGWDVPDLSVAIIASGVSTPKDFVQRVGRAVRFQKDKRAIIVNLCVEGTQEEKWVTNRTYGFETIRTTNVNEIDYADV